MTVDVAAIRQAIAGDDTVRTAPIQDVVLDPVAVRVVADFAAALMAFQIGNCLMRRLAGADRFRHA